MTTLRDRVEEAIAQGYGPAELARAAGVDSAAVSHWRKERTKSLKAKSALGLADLTGRSAAWWAEGKTVDSGHWKHAQHAAEGAPVYGVAQDLIHPTFEDEPTTCTWEFILSAVISDLPPRFSAAVPDDALAPVTPRGTGYIFAAGPAAPGDGVVVIVQAGNGRRYMRLYFAGAGDEWEARARDPAHRALHSVRDELVLLASATHRAGGQG